MDYDLRFFQFFLFDVEVDDSQDQNQHDELRPFLNAPDSPLNCGKLRKFHQDDSLEEEVDGRIDPEGLHLQSSSIAGPGLVEGERDLGDEGDEGEEQSMS